jgi:predicted transposase YdaD
MIDGQPYSFYRYEQILKEQLLIAWLSKGAITVTETNDMPIHDRKLLLNTLRKAEEDRQKKLEELRQSRAYRRKSK